MYPSIQKTPSYTPSPPYMEVYYPSISASPKPEAIVIQDKTNYNTQIILGGTAIGIVLVVSIGYVLYNNIKIHNTNMHTRNREHDEEKKRKIKKILDKLQEESNSTQCNNCRYSANNIDINIYVNDLFNLSKE